ncbi:pantoate--beta-alanine ligase [Sulfurimonas sp. MAG313]|nr:pantoate--beta-alanine ligase [Sulfurimonas sp. MAG313]MDF1880303.1 pantoate--beta-alanine ligase [Sulfurimonas sp. MAG313]
MTIIQTPQELQELLKNETQSIGFVPTMGALHHGHLSLIERSVKDNELTIVSIFVNPTQFLEGEDLDKYPNKFDADEKICKIAGVDILFYPQKEDMYEDDEIKVIAPNIRGFVLEGAMRPGHFDGVLTIVMKLLNIVSPTKAYFGKKDAQQLSLISQMVRNFCMKVEIVPLETVREDDGLALSSRNIYLDKAQRKEALKISSSLKKATQTVMQGNLNVKEIQEEMEKVLSPLNVEYISIVSRAFIPQKEIVIGDSIILVAAKLGQTRLIDNLWI